MRHEGTNGRYGEINTIQNYLAIGDYIDAQALLYTGMDAMTNTDSDAVTGNVMVDSVTADTVVANYWSFFQTYIDFQTGAATSNDTTTLIALANLCPSYNGDVVFQARAYYNVVFDTLVTFYDAGCDTGALPVLYRQAPQQNVLISQQYHLYPNPNSGQFTVRQAIADDAPVIADIWDAMGRRIYSGSLQFSNNYSKLNIGNVAAGVYMLHLTDTKGRPFTFKFLVQ